MERNHFSRLPRLGHDEAVVCYLLLECLEDLLMLGLKRIIERIRKLLDEDTHQSVTYAALETRLALEKVCYDRLRQRHDYISHEQLKKWQPGGVMNQLIADVDAHVTQTLTLQIGSSASSGVKPEDDEYVEVGTEIGFDVKQIVKMWNALGRLALHVKLPEHRDDHIPDYGDREKIKAKVEEVVAELQRLSKSTMVFSGLGETVSFECECREKNKRRAKLLKEGQTVYCFNPNCDWSYLVRKQGDEFVFEPEGRSLKWVGCGKDHYIPLRWLRRISIDGLASVTCLTCDHKNLLQWRLHQVRRADDGCVEKIDA